MKTKKNKTKAKNETKIKNKKRKKNKIEDLIINKRSNLIL
jgi:hypothetical protein